MGADGKQGIEGCHMHISCREICDCSQSFDPSLDQILLTGIDHTKSEFYH